MTPLLASVGLASGVVCLCLLVWLIRAAPGLGWLEPVGRQAHNQHASPVPNIGGVAIFWGIVVATLAWVVVIWVGPLALWDTPSRSLGAMRDRSAESGVLLAAIAAIHLLGLWDDRRPLGPWLKLGGQAAIAGFVVVFAEARVLEALGTWFGGAGVALSVLLSVLWLIVTMNALNFMDNMDGLAGGVAAICAAIFLAISAVTGQWASAAWSAALLGATVAFLLLNFPPARVFMGDNGSMLLGLMLGAIAMKTTYLGGEASVGGAWYGVLVPIVVLAVPLYDFTSVTLLRLARGVSPLTGDHNHFSHRLVRMGMTRRTAVLVIWLCVLATGLSGVMLPRLEGWQAALVGLQTLAVLAVLATLEFAADRRSPR
ncbi:MAG: MraY family glycosyltransferase [Planctomycetota bacterium]